MKQQTSNASGAPAAPSRVGRKRDPSRDSEIRTVTIELLAEIGYDRLTVDMIASKARAGKATVYRRWTSKAALVLDAVSHMGSDHIDLNDLPDTGSLRSDLLALYKPLPIEQSERKLRAMAGLATMLSDYPDFAEAANQALIEPWRSIYEILISRAVARGDVPATIDVRFIAMIVPSAIAYRSLVQRVHFDEAFLADMIDKVLLPALSAPQRSPQPKLNL